MSSSEASNAKYQPRIYLDNMATTRCLPEVVEAMLPYFGERFGNPQSSHPLGEEGLSAIETARQHTSNLVGAAASEIYFTSSATEANNWVLKKVPLLPRSPGHHIVTSTIEHLSILHTCRTLQKDGFDITYLPVDSEGFVDPDALQRSLRPDTSLVSITHASNEIGTIEPVTAIGAICRQAGIPFHVDAANTAGIIPIDVNDLNADLLTISPHMFYGPKGIGSIYCNRRLRLAPLIEGGVQESGRRAGTENVPAIVGFGKACELAAAEIPNRINHTKHLRDRLLDGFRQMERVRTTGHPTQRLPHHASCLVEQIESEGILLSLALESNIHAASGSACGAQALQNSYVLEAIGIDATLGNGSLVFGLSIDNEIAEIDYVLQELPLVIQRLRSMSPFG